MAGDTLQFTKLFGQYPISDGWSLSYAIAGANVLKWQSSYVTNDGTTFTVTVPNTITADLKPGAYEVTAILTGTAATVSAGQRVTIPVPKLIVAADPAKVADGERVSHAARSLPIIEAQIEGRLSADMQRYVIHGREVGKIPILELRRFRRIYRIALWKENHPDRTAPARKMSFNVV